MGAIEQDILKRSRNMGTPVPDRILNKPTLLLGLGLYYNAFYDLGTERQLGAMSPGRIAWSKVRQYAEVYKFNEDQAQLLWLYIAKMDTAFLKWLGDKNGESG